MKAKHKKKKLWLNTVNIWKSIWYIDPATWTSSIIWLLLFLKATVCAFLFLHRWYRKTDHTKLIHWFLSFSCVCTSNAYLHSTCVNFSPGHTWMPSDGGWSTQGSNDFSPARQHGALLSEKEEKATKKELVVLFHYPPAYKEIYIWVQGTQQNYTSKLLYKWKKRPKQLRLASIAPSICMHLRVCVCVCLCG